MTVDHLDNEADAFDDEDDEDAYFSHPEAMPQLSSLSLDRHFDWPLGVQHSTLRSLAIAPESWTGILDIVRLCDQLTQLRVGLSVLDDADMDFCGRLRDETARLPQIELVNLPCEFEAWAQSAFEASERKTLSLKYRPAPCACTTHRRAGTVDHIVYDATALTGGAIFRDLGDAVRLTVAGGKAGHNRATTIEGTDAAGRTHRIVMNACCRTAHGQFDLEHVLAPHALIASNVSSLTVDTSLWPSFAHAVSLAPGIRTVVLILRSRADVAPRRGFYTATAVLPALRELSLIAGRDDFQINEEDVVRLLVGLEFSGLDTLRIDRTVFRGEHHFLFRFSRAVSVEFCRVL